LLFSKWNDTEGIASFAVLCCMQCCCCYCCCCCYYKHSSFGQHWSLLVLCWS